jgi:hypothetical protein
MPGNQSKLLQLRLSTTNKVIVLAQGIDHGFSGDGVLEEALDDVAVQGGHLGQGVDGFFPGSVGGVDEGGHEDAVAGTFWEVDMPLCDFGVVVTPQPFVG